MEQYYFPHRCLRHSLAATFNRDGLTSLEDPTGSWNYYLGYLICGECCIYNYDNSERWIAHCSRKPSSTTQRRLKLVYIWISINAFLLRRIPWYRILHVTQYTCELNWIFYHPRRTFYWKTTGVVLRITSTNWLYVARLICPSTILQHILSRECGMILTLISQARRTSYDQSS